MQSSGSAYEGVSPLQRDTGSIAVVAVIDVDAVRVLDDVVLVGSRVVDLVGTSVVGTSVVGTSVVGTVVVVGKRQE